MTNRSPAGPRSCGALSGTSKPVSRVLSFKTAIYLAAPLPTRSSHPLNAAGQACCVPTVLLRIEFTAMRRSRTSGGLLPPPFHPYLVGTSSISLSSPQAAKLGHFAVPPPPKKAPLFWGPHMGTWNRGGISLLHFSWGRPRRVLPVILALRSPDFPHGWAFRPARAAVQLTCRGYCTPSRPACQTQDSGEGEGCPLYNDRFPDLGGKAAIGRRA